MATRVHNRLSETIMGTQKEYKNGTESRLVIVHIEVGGLIICTGIDITGSMRDEALGETDDETTYR